jgi:ABC-2 type transport system permease protein
MSASTQIASKDLKLRIRDRSAFIIGIIAPLALAFVFNLVFGSAFDTEAGLGLEYGMVDLDQSELSIGFTAILLDVEEDGLLTLETFADAETADQAVEDAEIDAYYLIPAGFSQAIFTGGSTGMHITGSVDSPTSTQIAASIAEQYTIGVESAQLAVATTASATSSPLTPEFIASLTTDPATAAFSYQIADVTAATRQLDAATYFSASMGIFFLFFLVQFGVLGMLEEEQEGTLLRLMAAPIPRHSVVSAKAILSFALGVISMAVLVTATTLMPGLDAQWGAPLGVIALVVAAVLAATGIMGLVASVAKTAEAAGNLGSIIAVTLGLLGGVFFPLGQGDDFLAKLTFISPHAWFMRGLANLAGDAPWTAALPSAGVLLLIAVVFGAIAWVAIQRRLER